MNSSIIAVALPSLTPYLLVLPFLVDVCQYAGGTLSPESPVRTLRKRNSSGSTSITDTDAYKEDERCIRINNLEESRPSIETVFKYTTKGNSL